MDRCSFSPFLFTQTARHTVDLSVAPAVAQLPPPPLIAFVLFFAVGKARIKKRNALEVTQLNVQRLANSLLQLGGSVKRQRWMKIQVRQDAELCLQTTVLNYYFNKLHSISWCH